MKEMNKIVKLALVLFVNAGVITACSQQLPNTATTSQQNSTTSSTQTQSSTTASTDVSAGLTLDQSSEISDTQSTSQDDEETIKDSELIADGEAGFATKAANINAQVNATAAGNINTTIAAKNKITKEERQQIIKDREKVLKARIKLLEAKLKLDKDLDKARLDKIIRKDVFVRTSSVVEIKNDDGTTTKVLDIKFTEKADASIYRENKISKTYSTDNKLIKIEHLITANMKNHTRNYTRVADVNADGSRNVVINSVTTWSNGKTKTFTEDRTVGADGSAVGNGTIVITTANGETKSYNVTINKTATGTVVIQPDTSSNPTPTA